MAFSNPLISVIIPVYNTEKYLKKCLDSCINQSYTNLEIILINDESPDDSQSIIEEYAASDNRIKGIKKENGGINKARKAGVLIAKGEYLIFLDSDDFLHKNAVELLVNEAYEFNSNYIIGDYTRENENGVFLSYVGNKCKELDRISVIKAFFTGDIQGTLSGKLIQRDLYQKVDFPPELIYAEDMISNIQILILNEGVRVRIVLKPTFCYVIHSKSAARNLNSEKAEIFFAHWLFIENLLIRNKIFFKVKEAFSKYSIRQWLIYNSLNGKLINDKVFVLFFYKKYLTFCPISSNFKSVVKCIMILFNGNKVHKL